MVSLCNATLKHWCKIVGNFLELMGKLQFFSSFFFGLSPKVMETYSKLTKTKAEHFLVSCNVLTSHLLFLIYISGHVKNSPVRGIPVTD